MLRQLNISNLQNFIHLTSLPSCKPEQPCPLKLWKILGSHVRFVGPHPMQSIRPKHEAMPASRKEASRDGGSGSISSWGWATPYSTLVMCNECFMHTSFCLEISSMQTAYYVDTLRMINYISIIRIRILSVYTLLWLLLFHVTTFVLQKCTCLRFKPLLFFGDFWNFPLSFICTRPTCSQWFTRQQTWSNNPPNNAWPEVNNQSS